MPWLVTPLAVSGSVSPVAPSSRMPAALYLSIRVWLIRITRGVDGQRHDVVGQRRRGHGSDREAVVGALVLTRARGVVGRLGGDDVGDAAAGDRALGVAEEHAGLGVDAAAVDRDAGEVDRQQALLGRVRPVLRVGAVDHHDRAGGVADVRRARAVGDRARARAHLARLDRHEVGARALDGDVVDDDQGVGPDTAAAFDVLAGADRDRRRAGLGRGGEDRVLDRLVRRRGTVSARRRRRSTAGWPHSATGATIKAPSTAIAAVQALRPFTPHQLPSTHFLEPDANVPDLTDPGQRGGCGDVSAARVVPDGRWSCAMSASVVRGLMVQSRTTLRPSRTVVLGAA